MRGDLSYPRFSKVWFVLALLTGFALRVPSFFHPWMADEAAYAYIAQRWFAGERLYVDLFIGRPQAILWLYGLVIELVGAHLWAIRAAAAVAASISTLFVFLIALEFFSSREQPLLASWLYAILAGAPHIEGYTANAETFMTPLCLAAIWLALLARPSVSRLSLSAIFGSGVALGMALLLKVSAFPLALVWLVLANDLRKARGWTYASLYAGACVSGVIVAGLPAIILGAAQVGWERYVYAVFWYRTLTDSLWATPLASQLASFLLSLGETLPVTAVPTAMGWLAWPHWKQHRSVTLLMAWLVGSFLGMSMGSQWFLHYYIQILPPLCVLAAAAWPILPQLFSSQSRKIILVVFACALYLTFELSLVWQQVPLLAPYALQDDPVDVAGDQVVELLRSRGTPHHRILVAYEAPQIVLRTGMRNATPYLSWRDVKAVPGAFDQTLAVISESRTDFVVVVNLKRLSREQNERLVTALNARYRAIGRFGEISVYERMERHLEGARQSRNGDRG